MLFDARPYAVLMVAATIVGGLLSLSASASAQDVSDPATRGQTVFNQSKLPTPPVVVLRTLDKVTARIKEVSVVIGGKLTFGTLEIAPLYCRSTPPIEAPETYTYLRITDRGRASRDKPKAVFQGWMVASSPALNPLEHPVYDVWVIACRTQSGDAFTGSADQSP